MKKIKFIAFVILSLVSIIYSYQTPQKIQPNKKQVLSITLEGAFNKTGEYPIKEGMLMKDIVKEVGVKKEANLKALPLTRKVTPEQTIYLPTQNKKSISLNKASLKELTSLKGVGEKTAQKIIDYRQEHSFIWIEDLMKVPGIGEKRFKKYRDSLCL